jgi:hypothetical protein
MNAVRGVPDPSMLTADDLTFVLRLLRDATLSIKGAELEHFSGVLERMHYERDRRAGAPHPVSAEEPA